MENRLPMKHPDMVAKVIQAAIDAQNAGVCTVFIDIAGHVQEIAVRLYFPVWKPYMLPTNKFSVYLDRKNAGCLLDKMLSEINAFVNSYYLPSPIQSETEVSEG